MRPDSQKDSEGSPNHFQATLCDFRESVRSAAEKPEDFWAGQRMAINRKLGHSSAAGWKAKLVWASVAMIAMISYAVFTENNKARIYVFAAGYDQNLLNEVERAINKNCPDALAPADILSQEIEKQNLKTATIRK